MLASESFLASRASVSAAIKLSIEILLGVASFLLLAEAGGASVGRGGSAADDDEAAVAVGADAAFLLDLVFCPSGGDAGGGGGDDDCMTTGSGGGWFSFLAPFIGLAFLVALSGVDMGGGGFWALFGAGTVFLLLAAGGAAFWATVFGKSTTAS